MTAIDELRREIKLLKARLSLAKEQRDAFVDDHRTLRRLPYGEMKEIIDDCNDQIEKLGSN